MTSDERGQSITRPPAHWQVILLLAFALLVRGGFLVSSRHNLQADPDGYRRLAGNLVFQGKLGDQVPIVRQQDDGAWRVTREFLPTAYRPPAYSLLLAAIVQSRIDFRFAVALLHLTLGLLTVWLTVRIGVQLGLGRAALLSGVLVACDPILLQQSSLVMTETLATFLGVLAIGCLIRCGKSVSLEDRTPPWLHFALAGGVLAIAALCRPTFLLMLPLAGCWLWFQWSQSSSRGKAAIAYLGSAVLVIAPWIARNAFLFGKPIASTTHGGYTFHLANNPGFYNYLRTAPWGTVWKSTDSFQLHQGTNLTLNMIDYPELSLPDYAAAQAKLGNALPADNLQQELLLDKLHYADAWRAIRDEPTMFAYSILVRLGRLWQPLPHRAAVSPAAQRGDLAKGASNDTSRESRRSWLARYLVALWYVGIYLLAAMGLSSLGWKLLTSPWCWGTILVATFMALHAFYWTDMRMRAPLVPVVCWYAAAGWNCYHSLRRARKV